MKEKLPLGIQGFEKLREENLLYVHKTKVIYQIINDENYFFLSRPRRFGKSHTHKIYWNYVKIFR